MSLVSVQKKWERGKAGQHVKKTRTSSGRRRYLDQKHSEQVKQSEFVFLRSSPVVV